MQYITASQMRYRPLVEGELDGGEVYRPSCRHAVAVVLLQSSRPIPAEAWLSRDKIKQIFNLFLSNKLKCDF